MGSTQYFQANVPASSLGAIAKTAAELPDWNEWSIFERFQRDIALKRVAHEIVPYLVRTKDRFFGSLIVLVYEPDHFSFEPINEMLQSLPSAYEEAGDQIGFLSINGGELVVLDGQHRLAALRAVVTAGDELEGPYRDAVSSDQLSVIFIQHQNFEKTRRIFNKVNRYARPTSPADNIVTSEDDGCAIVARWLVEPQPPLGLSAPLPPFGQYSDWEGEPVIEWRSTKLEANSTKITTLNALYQTVHTILGANGIENFDEKHRVNRPSDVELIAAYEFAATWWNLVLQNVPALSKAQRRPWTIPESRGYKERNSLLFRPIGLVAFLEGLAGATRLGLPIELAAHRAGRIRWRAADQMWTDTVIHANGHMNAKQSSVALAGRLATYRLAPELMSMPDIEILATDLATAKGRQSYALPKIISW